MITIFDHLMGLIIRLRLVPRDLMFGIIFGTGALAWGVLCGVLIVARS